MNITEEVKELIANGKTEEALEWLQSILKEKDTNLLNQTYLLQSQYIDIQKRLRLGLQDASVELQRVNFTLLTICDDVEKAGISGGNKPTHTIDSPSKDKSSLALWVFGIASLIAIGIVVGVVYISQGDAKNNQKISQNREVTTAKSPNTKAIEEGKTEWAASPNSTKILYPRYGNFKIDIKNIVAEIKDANTKTITVTLKLTCNETSSGSCIASYLEYRLVELDGDKKAPISMAKYDELTPKSSTNTEGVIQFIVPNTMQQADLQIFYTGEEKTTSSILKLRQK
jgi:hypothetical protein